MDIHDDGSGGLDRRTVLRRAAVTGGALVWAAPAVQTLAGPAFAAGSPLCRTKVDTGDCEITYIESPDCCACVEELVEEDPDTTLEEALATCANQGRCVESLRVCGDEEEPPDDDDRGDKGKPDVPTVIPAGSE